MELTQRNLLEKLLCSLDEPYIMTKKVLNRLDWVCKYLNVHTIENNGFELYKLGGSISLNHACLLNREVHDIDLILNFNKMSVDTFAGLFLPSRQNTNLYRKSYAELLTKAESIYYSLKNKRASDYNQEDKQTSASSDIIFNTLLRIDKNIEQYEEKYNKNCGYIYRLDYPSTDDMSSIQIFITNNFTYGEPVTINGIRTHVANPIEAIRAKIMYILAESVYTGNKDSSEEMIESLKGTHAYKHYKDLIRINDLLNDVFGEFDEG